MVLSRSIVLGVIAFAPALALAGSPLSNDPSPLAVCQDTVRTAAIRLEADAHRAVSACLTRGIECLVDDSASEEACCARAADRCRDDLQKLDKARAKFARYVGNRRCQVVSFADVTGADGLGYEKVADACGRLTPPATIETLDDLTACLARLSVAATACATGTREMPRALEALACTGFAEDFVTATDANLANCASGPAPTASPEAATPTPSSAATATPESTSTPLPTATFTAAPTTAATATPTPVATQTALATQTATATAVLASPTPTRTATPIATPTISATAVVATASRTATPVASATPSGTATVLATATAVVTSTPVATATAIVTPTAIATSTPIATITLVATQTPNPTATLIPTATRTVTPTPTRSATATPTPSATTTPGCGNGIKEAGEDCDDGNTFNCDSCPANCKNSTAPVACPTAGLRHAQQVHLVPPAGALLSVAQICIEYPSGVVALPGTGAVTGRVTGVNAITSLSDFNNAVQLSFVASPGFDQVTPTISFDLCTNATAPPPSSFNCVVKSASNQGDSISPPSLVQCTPQ